MRAVRVIIGFAVLLATGAADAPPATPAPPPAEQELIYNGEATSILGRDVFDPADAKVGRIVDVLVGEMGQPRAAVIDFGGFMGVGQRRIAVAWRALHFLPAVQQHHIRLELTTDQIKATPDYRRDNQPLDPPLAVAVPPPAPAPVMSK